MGRKKIREGWHWEKNRIRNSTEGGVWKRAVLKRDGNRCTICGRKEEHMEVDHIKGFVKYPLLRFVVTNGRTLCEWCAKRKHKETTKEYK